MVESSHRRPLTLNLQPCTLYPSHRRAWAQEQQAELEQRPFGSPSYSQPYPPPPFTDQPFSMPPPFSAGPAPCTAPFAPPSFAPTSFAPTSFANVGRPASSSVSTRDAQLVSAHL